MKKKKLHLVPHMHWDREWYFTIDTANVLLNTTIHELLNNIKQEKMLLDGQWSLVDEFVKSNPSQKDKMAKLLQSENISSGPLYTQPDVFNSQGETTLRNFEIGRKMSKEYGVKHSHTAYLPDTFGFNQNFPQILKHAGMKNFVHWRGAPKSILDQSDVFNWEGVDGTKIKTHTLKFGYYTISMYYPYASGKVYPEKKDASKFAEKIMDRTSRQNNMGEAYILPMGGDQAPYQWDQKKYFAEASKNLPDFEIQVDSNYQTFMDAYKEKMPVYKGDLKEPFTGKIHRTIGASRYDIKNKFRVAEDSLYYMLEPFEIFFASRYGDYNFESYKDENIHKPLLIAQAHDSLGSCNTDITNKYASQRLTSVQQNIDSQVDNIFKRMEVSGMIKDENMMFFNPAPFKTDYFERKTIYSDKNKIINMENNNFGIYTISSKNIGMAFPLYEQDVLIYKRNNKPGTFDFIDLTESNKKEIPSSAKENKYISIGKDSLTLKFSAEKKVELKFNLITDNGDSYDFSPGPEIKTTQKHKIISSIKLDDSLYYVEVQTSLSYKSTKLNWYIWVDVKNNEFRTTLKTKNKLKSTKVSLDIIAKGNVMKSQHLAITNFVEDDSTEDWNKKFTEYPAHVDVNDGLVSVGKLNVLTKGNNELFKTKDGVRLTLYRSYPFVTQHAKKTSWRPVFSGLAWYWKSPDAELQKDLAFDLVFSFNTQVKALNHNKFRVGSYKIQQSNFIARKMTKFAINDNINPKKATNSHDIKVDEKKVLISSMRIDPSNKKNVLLRAVNPLGKPVSTKIIYKGKEVKLELKPYEIKKVKLLSAVSK